MSRKPKPKPWRVTDVRFVEIRIQDPVERQMRVELDCGARIIISRVEHIELVARLMEALCGAGRGVRS